MLLTSLASCIAKEVFPRKVEFDGVLMRFTPLQCDIHTSIIHPRTIHISNSTQLYSAISKQIVKI